MELETDHPRSTRKDYRKYAILIGLSILFLSIVLIYVVCTQSTKSQQYRYSAEIWDQISSNYFWYEDFQGEFEDDRAQMNQAIQNGLEWSEFYDTLNNYLLDKRIHVSAIEKDCVKGYFFAGMFMVPSPEQAHAQILFVHPNSPAADAGIRQYDEIVSINNESALDQNGELRCFNVDENVELSVLREKSATIQVEISPSNERFPFGGEAYRLDVTENDYVSLVRIFGFDAYTTDLFKGIYGAAHDDQRIGIILDLRYNAWGDYASTTDFLSLFIKDKTLDFVTRNGIERVEIPYNEEYEIYKDLPIVILVNDSTAGTAEVFTYVMQKYRNAYVIGEETPGSWEKYSVEEIEGYCYLLIPTGYFLGIDGQIDGGIIPDEAIAHTSAYFVMSTEDEGIQKGIEYFENLDIDR